MNRPSFAVFTMGILAPVAASLAVPGIAQAQQPAASAQQAGPETAASTKRKVKSKVMPEYPAIAKSMELTGKVKILATISAEGRVTNTKVIGGNPLLASAAAEALKRWRFEAAPKETAEVIEFEFSGQN